MQKRPYSLEEPGDFWEHKFEEVKRIIKSAFGDKIISIDHVGSNSFGIKAKPLLDILVVVKDINDLPEEKVAMEKFGYSWEDNYIEQDSVFFYKLEGERKIENIHVMSVGHQKIDQFLLTKEYFLAHPDALKEYEDLKISLNRQFPDDYPAYRAGKNDFLQNILRLAREWRDNK